jgi:hypothetical protein
MGYDALKEVNQKRQLRDLAKWRPGGAPSAKKFRRRARLEQADKKIKGMLNLLVTSTVFLRRFEAALTNYADESNWATRTEHFAGCASKLTEGTDCTCAAVPEVLWVGEEDPLEIATKELKAWRDANEQKLEADSEAGIEEGQRAEDPPHLAGIDGSISATGANGLDSSTDGCSGDRETNSRSELSGEDPSRGDQ